jgi:hypothetical protein
MERAASSEMFALIYQITRCYITEDHLNIRRRDNLTSHLLPCSHEPAIEPYPNPSKSSSYPQLPISSGHILILGMFCHLRQSLPSAHLP